MLDTMTAATGLVRNVFWEWEEPAEEARGIAPVRVIPVTPAMRRADAEARAAREQTSGWPLREAMRARLAGWPADEPLKVTMPPRGPKPRPQPAAASSETPAAVRETKRAAPKPILAPPAPIRGIPEPKRAVRETRPGPPAVRTTKVSARKCSAGCGRKIHADNRFGICTACRLARPVCSRPECERRLRSGVTRRADGLCGYHGQMADHLAGGRVYERRRRELDRHCVVCDKLLAAANRSGRCREHTLQGLVVMLKAASEAEHAVNQAWAALSLVDRLALLELGGGAFEEDGE